MPQKLRQQLQELHEQLAKNPPLDEQEKQSLAQLAKEIETRLTLDQDLEPSAEKTLADSINLAVDRFEISHPMLSATLRNILQSLASMGI